LESTQNQPSFLRLKSWAQISFLEMAISGKMKSVMKKTKLLSSSYNFNPFFVCEDLDFVRRQINLAAMHRTRCSFLKTKHDERHVTKNMFC
jgi:hypothetical protein